MTKSYAIILTVIGVLLGALGMMFYFSGKTDADRENQHYRGTAADRSATSLLSADSDEPQGQIVQDPIRPDEGEGASSSGGSVNARDIGERFEQKFIEIEHRKLLRSIRREKYFAINALGLSDEKRKALEDILVMREQAVADSAELSSGSSGNELLSKTISNINIESENAIRALIGEEGLAKLKRSSQLHTIGRMLDESVGIDMRSEGVPLTGDQMSKLIDSMDKSSSFSLRATDLPRYGVTVTENSAYIIKQAESVLSPEQLAILVQYYSDQYEFERYRDVERERN
ncbi:MAG: hypothetical protein R3F03_07910 [Opitutaceae bacterium]